MSKTKPFKLSIVHNGQWVYLHTQNVVYVVQQVNNKGECEIFTLEGW